MVGKKDVQLVVWRVASLVDLRVVRLAANLVVLMVDVSVLLSVALWAALMVVLKVA